jgi:hypothetical protein
LDTIGRAEEIPTTASSALVGALEDSASVDEVIEDILADLAEQSSEILKTLNLKMMTMMIGRQSQATCASGNQP